MAEINVIQKEEITRAVLIAVSLGREEAECENSLAELERLLDTAGGVVAATVIQNRPHPDKATYIGSGKCEEVAELVKSDPTITLAVFDNELSPSQIAAVEEIVGIRVIDRTTLEW